jgi:hypothetical protein
VAYETGAMNQKAHVESISDMFDFQTIIPSTTN